MLRAIKALLPRACPGCGAQLGRQEGLCLQCRAQLQPQLQVYSPLAQAGTPPQLVSLGRYQGPAGRAVRALKYGGACEVALPLGQLLGQGIPAHWQICAVVPVPLHKTRERERGFNQAALLAQVIAETLQVAYAPVLTRTRATAQQARQQRDERHKNLQGAFAVTGQVPQGALLLVDDVLTTSATLAACRDALVAAQHSELPELYYAVVAR